MTILSIILLTFALMAVHEAGHALVAHLLGLHFHIAIVRNPWRLVVGVMFPGDVIAKQDLMIAIGGPLASILIGIALLPITDTGAAISILIGLLNLLPLRHSDGWRIARAAKAL